MNRTKLEKLTRMVAKTVVIILTGAASVAAQSVSGASGSIVPGSSLGESLMPSFGKVGLILLVVIAGIYLTLSVLKKMMGRRVSSGAQGSALELVETCYLSPKKSVSFVRLGNKSALLAVTETTITSVMELDADETTETLAMIKRQGKSISFTESLSKAKKKIVDLRAQRASSAINAVSLKENTQTAQEA